MKAMDPIRLTRDNADSLWDLITRLFPIHRTIVNRGFRRSLELIGERIPLEIQEIPSGTRVWDWIVPDAWDVNEAFIEDSKGSRLVDFKDNNLHLSAYSTAFDGTVSHEELLRHLAWLEDVPEAIPFGYKYYTPDWQFCVEKRRLARFTDQRYRVKIDVDRRKGEMALADCFLPGREAREIVLSCYLCHPSLANDSLSGVVVGTEIFRALSKVKNRRYSYRLVIVPETVGCVAYLATHEKWIPKVRGGYLLTCCGDPGPITYKKSYHGDDLIDRAALHVLSRYRTGQTFRVQDYVPMGSDERQFNSPGVRRPFGSFMRTPYAEFREYHNSLDSLYFVKKEALMDTAQAVLDTLHILDNNAVYKNCYRAEPFLSRHGLHIPFERSDQDGYVNQIISHETDGTQDLLAIADKHARSFRQVRDFNARFEKEGLVSEVKPRRGEKR